jgi:hypothetical protein
LTFVIRRAHRLQQGVHPRQQIVDRTHRRLMRCRRASG